MASSLIFGAMEFGMRELISFFVAVTIGAVVYLLYSLAGSKDGKAEE